jgi:hypothetical protein
MTDKNLTDVERELAGIAGKLANAVDSHAELDGFWAEELIPPMSEDEVLSSSLYTRPGNSVPVAGFTLWRGGKAYRVAVSERT